MATKKKAVQATTSFAGEVPKDLTDHPFYGFQLDEEQQKLRDAIWNPDIDIVFCNSKAGTGKTFVTLGTANLLVRYGLFDNIVWLVNPTQEQILGYRPGTTESKVAPYVSSLYDAAVSLGINPYSDIDICSDDYAQKKTGYIECTTPIFLRGRNIPCTSKEKTILICDEAQNFYIDQLQTVLTRVNGGAKVVVIGHTGQCDLRHGSDRSGFAPFIRLFQTEPRCAVCELKNNHRSWISRHADTINEFLATETEKT